MVRLRLHLRVHAGRSERQRTWPADLYLEGSDQHRGWFQSSNLLEGSATRGHAPYKAVLTHGFTLDEQGEKMSKSKGNTVDPLKVIADSGAEIIRLWVAMVDYAEDQRIGKTILQTVSDSYRKLRNTIRYLLGALEGFTEETERLPLERDAALSNAGSCTACGCWMARCAPPTKATASPRCGACLPNSPRATSPPSTSTSARTASTATGRIQRDAAGPAAR